MSSQVGTGDNRHFYKKILLTVCRSLSDIWYEICSVVGCVCVLKFISQKNYVLDILSRIIYSHLCPPKDIWTPICISKWQTSKLKLSISLIWNCAEELINIYHLSFEYDFSSSEKCCINLIFMSLDRSYGKSTF